MFYTYKQYINSLHKQLKMYKLKGMYVFRVT